jgi:hypothetical protein
MSLAIKSLASRAAHTMRTAGLHKVAGVMLGVEELTMKEAAREIGRRAFMRRAETKKIAAGIEALAELNGEKTGGVLSELLKRQAVPTMIGAGAAALPDLLAPGPVDQDRMMQHMLLGGGLGALGGAAHLHGKVMDANPNIASQLSDAVAKMPR